MTALMAGQQQNIIQAIRDYGRQLFAFIRSRVGTQEEAEDILQDVWYQLSNQPESQVIGSLSGWLYRVARNRITDRYRKKKEVLLDDLGSWEEDEDFSFRDMLLADFNTPETTHLRELFWEQMFAALDELPEAQRSVFVMNELEDMTLQQIADQQGEKLKTIISRKRYAVLHLRERLEDLYNDLINY
ncbi:MAG TPA: RNA polymerase sigma factor [Chitinophagaceae bacterium]|nr:RNA polymerase sigma factor [Chitinophagaceae bacterium]